MNIEKNIKEIIGNDIKKCKKIKYGSANIVYNITTIDNKEYILKIYNMQRKFYLIDTLNEYLKINGIRTLNSLSNGVFDNKYYYLYTKNEGEHKYYYNLNMIDTILDVIYIENQNVIEDISEKDTIFEKYCLYKEYFAKNTVKKVSIEIIEYINKVSKQIELKNNNLRLIHGDLSVTNILWRNSTMSIIDFDEAIYAPIEYELASFIIKICFNNGYFNKRLGKKIMKNIQAKFNEIDYYLLRNSWLLYITKVIYEKLYFYELGYIDIESREHKKDYWKWWLKLLKNHNLFDEIYFDNVQMEQINGGISVKNNKKSLVKIIKLGKSEFVLKKSKVNKYENTKTERELLNLLSMEVNVPRILKIKNHRSYIYKLYTYMEGEHRIKYTANDEENIINSFKKLNNKLNKISIRIKTGDLEKKIIYLKRITKNKFYKKCLEQLLSNKEFILKINTEEKQIIHDDLHSNNILYNQDKIIFLDFEGIKKYPKSLQIASFITNFYLYHGKINKLEYIFNEFKVSDKEYIMNLVIYRMIKTLIYFENSSKNQDDELKEEKIYNTLQKILNLEVENMELRDYYNINKERTGETYTSDIEPTGDRYMLIVVCFMQNAEGKFLIQRASKEKGNKWGSTGGHPKSGEDSIEGMHTEIFEELGIDISKEKYKYVNTFIGHNKILDLYYIKEEIDISKLKLQIEEVEEVKWMTEEEIENLIEQGVFEKTHARLFKDLKIWLDK